LENWEKEPFFMFPSVVPSLIGNPERRFPLKRGWQ